MDNYTDIEAFLNPVQEEEVKIAISDRFKNKDGETVKWVLKAVPTPVANAIRKKYTKIDNKGRTVIDGVKINTELAAVTVVYPNLKDERLQNAYGTCGELDTLYAMLRDGEVSRLVKEALKVNGYGKSLEEAVEEVKNV